jgi:hypothetical protein
MGKGVVCLLAKARKEEREKRKEVETVSSRASFLPPLFSFLLRSEGVRPEALQHAGCEVGPCWVVAPCSAYELSRAKDRERFDGLSVSLVDGALVQIDTKQRSERQRHASL